MILGWRKDCGTREGRMPVCMLRVALMCILSQTGGFLIAAEGTSLFSPHPHVHLSVTLGVRL